MRILSPIGLLFCLCPLLNFPWAVGAQTPILCGQSVTNTTAVPDQVDHYSYFGSTGQSLSFAFWGPINCPNDYMVADFYNPDGQLLGSLAGGCDTNHVLTLTLTNTGTYTVLVHESLDRATGSYALSIQSLKGGGCNGGTISCGQTVTASTDFNTQMDAYGYTGIAGQVLSLALWGLVNCDAGADYMVADIYGPDGQWVDSLASDCNAGYALSLTLTKTGTYTIVMHENVFRKTGSYDLSIQSLTGGGCSGRPIACGQTVTASTDFNTQMDAYSYDGTAGQVLSFALWGPVSCDPSHDYMVADIYGPDGQWVNSLGSDCNAGRALTLTLTNTGTYTIVVHENFFRNTRSYNLSIQSLTSGGCSEKTIACGQTVVANISYQSQMHAYGYAGAAGDVVSIALWGPVSCVASGDYMVADIYGPDGQWVDGLASDCNAGRALTLTLTNTGTYTIVVHENFFRNTGSYSLSIQSATGGGCGGKTIVCGQTVVARTAFYSQMDAYSYAGVAGQVLTWTLVGPIGCPYDFMVADIYGPGGELVASLYSLCDGRNSLELTLTNAGNYTVLVHEYIYRAVGTYSLGLTVAGGCTKLSLDSATVRTQQVVCLPLQISSGSPVVWMSFTVQAPAGILSDGTLHITSPFTNGTITPGTNSQWFVTMQTSLTNGVVGDQVVGSVCFTVESIQSVFALVGLFDLVVTNQDGTVPGACTWGSRVAVIAQQALLEATLAANNQRMLSVYGKPNTDYVIEQATNRTLISSWVPAWTNTVPATLSYTAPVPAPFSNSPVLILRARER